MVPKVPTANYLISSIWTMDNSWTADVIYFASKTLTDLPTCLHPVTGYYLFIEYVFHSILHVICTRKATSIQQRPHYFYQADIFCGHSYYIWICTTVFFLLSLLMQRNNNSLSLLPWTPPYPLLVFLFYDFQRSINSSLINTTVLSHLCG